MKYQKILNITFLLFSLLLIGCKIQEVSGEVKRVDTKYESLIIKKTKEALEKLSEK